MFRDAVDEINALSSDVVLVTGDLTEDGLVSQFQMAAKALRALTVER